MTSRKKVVKEPKCLSEILRENFFVIGGAMVMPNESLPKFIRALHKWSRERYAKS